VNRVAALRLALVAVVIGIAAYITYVAVAVRVEQYDGFVYLNNAKRLLELPPARFEHWRPPLLSLAMVVPVELAAWGPAGGAGYFVWPHLAAVVITLLSTLAVGLLLRRQLGITLALVGVVGFVTSRLFIRYGPFVMADQLSAGVVASVLAVYLRTWTDSETAPSMHDYRLCGLLLGFALLTKQPLILMVPAMGLSEILYAVHFRRWERRRLVGLVVTMAVGTLVFIGVQLFIFTWLYGADAIEAAVYSVKNDFSPRSVSNRLAASTVGDSSWNYASLAWHVFSPPVVVVGAIGVLIALRERQARDLPVLAWLVVLGGTLTCLISHTEARYLLPVAPMWLFFVLRAAETGMNLVWHKGVGWRVTAVALALLAMLSLGRESVLQLRLNSDPFYTADSQRRTLQALLAARGPHGKLRWFGPLATLHPAHRASLVGDDYFDIFHIGSDSLEYFLREPIVPLEQIADLGDGDAVLKAPDTYYRGSSLPPGGAPPPQIWSTRVLGPSPASPAETQRLQTADGAVTVRLGAEQGRLTLTPEQSAGPWYVYVRLSDGKLVGGAPIVLRAGQAVVLDISDRGEVAGLLLMAEASAHAALL
jgi:hypothetical protein